VGIGFEPMVNYVASSFKRISCMASYLLGFLQVLLNYPKAVPLTITTEKEKIVLETQQISVCNGRRMGSTFIMGPKAEVDDGLLDVVYANTPIAGSKILWYALKFFSGTQLKSKKFSMIRSDEVKIEAAEDLLVCHADGEGVSQGCRTIEVKLYKNGLKFIRKRETVFD
jgi:diacylglycerol kinase family enzyme